MKDCELLLRFGREKSEVAFREFVQRHADWVFSTCRRRLGDAALAEDAAQAVFLAAAQKAEALFAQKNVGPWLYRAARFAAGNIQRERRRREKREREAAALKTEMAPDGNGWDAMQAELEPALDRLRAADREAIVLRFYQKLSHQEMAAALDISEEAAQKRLSRALDRLRKTMRSAGEGDAALSVGALSVMLAQHAVSPAPAGFAGAMATAWATGGGTRLAMMGNGILRSMIMSKVKAMALGALVLCLLGGGVVLWPRGSGNESQKPAVEAAALSPAGGDVPANVAATVESEPNAYTVLNTEILRDGGTNLMALTPPGKPPIVKEVTTSPVKISNALIFPTEPRVPPLDARFGIGLDAAVIRTAGGDASGFIRIDTGMPNLSEGTRSFNIPADFFRGKRIAFSGWIRSQAVENHARLRLGVWDADKKLMMEGSTAYNDPVHGDMDWRQYKIVADVPKDAADIMCTVSLAGPGEIWVDGLQIETVPNTEPVTDDQLWNLYSPRRTLYESARDPSELRNGQPAVRINSIGTLPDGTFCIYDRVERDIGKYLGKRVRVTMWMKMEGISGTAYTAVRVRDGDQQVISRNQPGGPWVAGNADWRAFTTEAEIPQNAKYIDFGMTLNGAGKVWVDQAGVTCEVVGDGPGSP